MGMNRHFALLLTIVALTLVGCSQRKEPVSEPAQYQSVDSLPMLIMQIQKSSRLYTAEYHIHKIVTHDDVVKLQGNLLKQNINIKLPVGDRKVAIPMDATLKAYIDFGSFSEKNIERQGDKITVVLPDPKVEMTSSKVNQREIKAYVGLVRAGFSDEELSNYEQQGREAIIRSIPQLGIFDMAQENAARTLIPMFEQMGFKEQNITIAFRKDFQPDNIRALMENIGGK
jgi:hypothetical protein